MAAEWVKDNIALFGGDPDDITLAGQSAGAYSAEAQMLYEFRKPGPKSSTYRRIFMVSNAIPAQPKSLENAQVQFDELCRHFKIYEAQSASEKLSALRRVGAQNRVQAIPKLQHHTFRPVTGGLFIHPGMIEYTHSKQFSDEFTTREYQILISEVANEETLYSTYNSPEEPTVQALRHQIMKYYAPEVTDRALKCYQLPGSTEMEKWKKLFGKTR